MLSRRTVFGLATLVVPAIARASGEPTSCVGETTGDNLFPNTQWQLLTPLGPSWLGQPDKLGAHLDDFETEQNWRYSGAIPPVSVSRLDVETDSHTGAVTVVAQGDSAVQFLYPDAVIVFLDGADPALRLSSMRVRTIDYASRRFTFHPPRNARPAPGPVGFACRQVMRCDRRGVTDHGPDGWRKTTSAHLWIDRWPALPTRASAQMNFDPGANPPGKPAWRTNLRPSMKRCVVFQPQDAAPAQFYHRVKDHISLRGRTMVFGMWVERVAGGAGRLFVDDGVTSRSQAVVEAAGWTWLEMSHTVAADAQSLDFGFLAEGESGSTWRIGEPRLDYGERLGVGAYVRPKGRIERFVVKITPDSYFGANFSFGEQGGVMVDIAGETTMSIAEDVPIVYGQLEGTPDVGGRPLFTRSQFDPPVRYGAPIHAPLADQPASLAAPFDMGDDGTMWLYSTPGAAWRFVSFDLDQAVLW